MVRRWYLIRFHASYEFVFGFLVDIGAFSATTFKIKKDTGCISYFIWNKLIN